MKLHICNSLKHVNDNLHFESGIVIVKKNKIYKMEESSQAEWQVSHQEAKQVPTTLVNFSNRGRRSQMHKETLQAKQNN